ncbi:hypothetical protein H257_06916 [Aphanomyces astaci]|uniref:Uncharacterized protein n=1 Tax=Aphanomyces astaci TaxID=112090 RepID=W4GL86_APHAT|nr:hypothetical protein H257_06916 [Aphanomyces astaci]ETV79663.1 hypothetical protein H257_06916 [Aphanomyces astaci]|eukprot:XP_009830599.1 hypothetical protein H257_06916 [Aphanomyces astaci]
MVVPSVNTTHEGMALCPNVCQALMLDRPLSFLKNSSYFGDNEVWFSTIAALAATAQADVRNVAVEVFQYGTVESTSSNVTFLRHALFDESLPAQREVISLQGDRGTINLLTTNSPDVDSLVKPLEVPVNVASYIRYACLYMTSAIICVAFLSTLYLLANRGYVEGLNMLELNRVAGVVWVGHTLLFVRGLAAISLLSTQVLTLTPVGGEYSVIIVGTIAIGSFGRFETLIGVCVRSIFISYAYERLRHPHLGAQGQTSYFLSASAKYVFEPKHWTEDKYYIDPASAVINGILSIQVTNTFYVFDLKIWRLFVIDEPDSKRKRLHDEGAFHLLHAIPLTN